MNLDTSLSLDVVINILVIFGAVWRLDGKIAGVRDKLEGEIKASRNELKSDIQRLDVKIDETRNELKGDIAELRSELKSEIAESRSELKGDINWLGTRIENVDAKVDNGNQRLARLEGRFEGREERLTAEGDPAA